MRRLRPAGLGGLAILALLAVTAAGTAIAYFTTSGSGESAPKAIAMLTQPSIATVTPAPGGTVALEWTAVTPPGSGGVSYTVQRDGGGAAGTCTSKLSVTSCVDSGLKAGAYTYVVTAKWRSWSASSTGKAANVTVGPADRFVLSAATSAPIAGAANSLTITAKDEGGGTVTTYTGSHALTFSGAPTGPEGTTPTVSDSTGKEVAFGSATQIEFSAGVASVSAGKNGAMKLYKSGPASISVGDGSISTKASLAVTVSAGTASKLALSAATNTPAAGTADNLTTTAQDAYGNVATSYTGAKSLTFSGASASPNGAVATVSDSTGKEVAFGSATQIEFSAGVATVSAGKNGAMKLYKSGPASIKVGDGSLTAPAALTVTVSVTATRFLLAASATSLTAGGSANLTITALDAYENTVTGYAGSKSLTFSGASASPGANKPTVSDSSGNAVNFGTATPIGFSAGVASVSTAKNGVITLYAAEVASIVVSDGTISNQAPLKVTVSPAAMSKFALTAVTTTPTTGASDSLTTTAQDTYGNTVTSYAGPKSLTFSGASASPDGTVPTVSDYSGASVAFGSATSIVFSAGVASVSGASNGVMKLYKSGSTTVKVTEGSFSGSLSVTVAATATKLLLAAATTTPVAAASDNLTITAQDPYNNVATAYTGAKSLTFGGASASPSGAMPTVSNSSGTAVNFGTATPIGFTAGVASVSGTSNGVMKLNRAEAAKITVSDGSISNPTPLAVTASVGAAARWGIASIKVSAGALGSNCLFTCTLTGLGNSGTVTAKVVVTDSAGNTVSALGSGHAAKITTSGSGTISGTPLAIPSTGLAESATTFTFTSRSSGAFTETVTAAFAEGAAYTAATLTASR